MAITSNFCFNYKDILIDEIALNGLEGIGIKLLWKRMEKRISSEITPKIKARFWDYILKAKCVSIFEVPEPLPDIELIDRFSIVNENNGYLEDPDYIDGPYEYCPIPNDYGSCSNYNSRVAINKTEMLNASVDCTEGNKKLVLVATLEERWRAMAPHLSIDILSQLTPVLYCLLELIGRSRENGQMTVGKTNLNKILKDPKLLFYNRRQLQQLDLVRVQQMTQVVAGKASNSLLLRLRRFHQPIILSQPKVGKIHDLIAYLRNRPDYSERTDIIMKKKLITHQICKRLQKSVNNVFSFSGNVMKWTGRTNTKGKTTNLEVKKRVITVNSKSDESSNSEDETNEEALKCQYKVGVGLLRQAYELFLAAGRTGITQIQLSELLGVEFYTSRTICRTFKSKHIIREFLEDKGRQRTARYVAVAVTNVIDGKYAEEKKKFLEYIDKADEAIIPKVEDEDTDGDEDIPKKRLKFANEDDLDEVVTEVKVIDEREISKQSSLVNAKKLPTLRQLKYANGILKITRNHLCVVGYQTLSILVAKEIGEPPMDSKAIKKFIQKLIIDRQIKILKLKWPTLPHKFSVLICAPHIRSTHPIIKKIYKEICVKAYYNAKQKNKKTSIKKTPPAISQFAFPPFMKLQKLHEFIIKAVYLDDNQLNQASTGFATITELLPEMTVEFAIGNISNLVGENLPDLRENDEVYHKKLYDAPHHLQKQLLESKSFQSSIKLNMKVLATIGLIQFVRSTTVPGFFFNSSFYVNRNAKILDTTGSWPKNDSNIEIYEKSFEFNTFEDVTSYWDAVHDISISTMVVARRNQSKVNTPLRTESEVKIYDTGRRYGDALGPCGFDSSVYMDIPKLWRTLYKRVIKTPQFKKKPTIKVPKAEKRRLKRKKADSLIKSEKEPKITYPDKGLTKTHRKRLCDLVTWNKSEDTTLIMCKAAITILSPSSQPGSLRVRNTVAKDILSIKDSKKTPSACHRRNLVLDSNAALTHEKECILNELRRRPNLIRIYEGVLKKNRLRNSANLSKFINDSRLQMLELVWIISQVVQTRDYNKKQNCIASNLEDFHKKYSIVTASSNKPSNMYQTPYNQFEIGTIKEAIVMTVTNTSQNELDDGTSAKIYSMFKVYPEITLRSAVEQLRKCSAISPKEKILHAHLQRLNCQDMLRSSYKMSAIYIRKLDICKLNNEEFIKTIAELLDSELPQDQIKAAPASNCLFCELQAYDVLDLKSTNIPIITGSSESIIQEEQLNTIDLEIKYKIKSGTVGWKSKCNVNKFSDLYKEVEFGQAFQKIIRNATLSSVKSGDNSDNLIQYLKQKGEEGTTYQELLKIHNGDSKSLIYRLAELEYAEILKRVGYYENRVVLTEFINPWAIKIDDRYLIPSPWSEIESGQISYQVFLKWAGAVMNKVLENPGCSVAFISENCEYITARSAQEICMFLEDCDCVKLNTVATAEVDLFSDEDATIEINDFNPYDLPSNIVVHPLKNSITKYAYLKKMIQDLNDNVSENDEESL